MNNDVIAVPMLISCCNLAALTEVYKVAVRIGTASKSVGEYDLRHGLYGKFECS